MSCMCNSSSSSLYTQILNKGVLTLPSIRTINRLCSALNVDTGFNESTLFFLLFSVYAAKQKSRNLIGYDKR